MGLFDVAEKLGIEVPPPDEEQIEILKKNIHGIRKKSKEMKNTASWEWYHSNNKNKASIMTMYLTTIINTFRK